MEAYPSAVASFLRDYKASITYLLENPDDGCAMIEANGIFAKAAVAKKALPNCNICYLDGEDMKAAMEIYLSALAGINAASIGGSLPSEDFYYIKQ